MCTLMIFKSLNLEGKEPENFLLITQLDFLAGLITTSGSNKQESKTCYGSSCPTTQILSLRKV